MTTMTPAVKERQKKARARAGRIREGMRSYIHTLGDIAAAWADGDWRDLGYRSWDEYVAEEFSADRVRLPLEQRQKAVDELRLSGMSNRAIASVVNVDEATIRRDVGAANAAVIDGEYVDDDAPPPARSPVAEALEQAITDAAGRAEDHRESEPGAPEPPPVPDPDPPSLDTGTVPGAEAGDRSPAPASAPQMRTEDDEFPCEGAEYGVCGGEPHAEDCPSHRDHGPGEEGVGRSGQTDAPAPSAPTCQMCGQALPR